MGSPERPPGERASNQGKKPQEKRIRIRSGKGFKHTPLKDLLGTEEYHAEGPVVDAKKLLDYVREAPKIGTGRKRVRVY